jgi:hypothetical protein
LHAKTAGHPEYGYIDGIESGLDSLEKQFNSDKIKKQSQRILGFNRRHYENRGN